MAGPRRFDHDEARQRYAAGESMNALARAYGVYPNAVARVVNPDWRLKENARNLRRCRDSREPCLGGCGRLVWTLPHRGRSGYCRICYGISIRSDQHGTEGIYARCHCDACREAATAAKRRRREASRVPCSHGCGRMVDSINRRDPTKPYECRSCARRRVCAELKAEGRLGKRKKAA